MGLSRCRKCGAGRPSYTTDGESIVVTREKPRTPPKRANTGKKRATMDDEPRRDSFIESTLAFLDEKRKGRDNGDD